MEFGSAIENPIVQGSLIKSVGLVTVILNTILKVAQSVEVRISFASVIKIESTPLVSEEQEGSVVFIVVTATAASELSGPNYLFVQVVVPQDQSPQEEPVSP